MGIRDADKGFFSLPTVGCQPPLRENTESISPSHEGNRPGIVGAEELLGTRLVGAQGGMTIMARPSHGRREAGHEGIAFFDSAAFIHGGSD